MRKRIFLICLVSFSWGTYAQHGHSDHQSEQQNEKAPAVFVEDEVNKIYSTYLNLQKALVNSNQKQAHRAASDLQGIMEEIKNGKELHTEAEKIAAANSLTAQREVFTALSEEMIKFIKNQELSEGKIYLGYCPMANQNEGGSWLSASNAIRNPYFGDKMLKCGTIKEIIE